MRDPPVAVRYSPFVDTTSEAHDAIAISNGPGGMPNASVLRTRGNGLFTRFGQPVRAGITSDKFQRYPVDVCIADFVGNGTRSGVIINQGTDGIARHSMIAGSGTSNPPISFNENLRLGLVLDHHRDVVQELAELRRQPLEGSGHQSFELVLRYAHVMGSC